ncbi:MAG: hypothetical protein LBJ01_11175, partial [Tannerella sp.]|nr:hypothetical protein [Tannerella sp.]
LRWGITGDDVRQGQTVRLCLSEIDNCRPCFLGILNSTREGPYLEISNFSCMFAPLNENS